MENNSSRIVREFLSLSKYKKIAAILILVICLGAGVGIPFIIEKSNVSPPKTPPQIKEVPQNITPTVSVPISASLKLSSDKTNYKMGDNVMISINLYSGTYGIGAADFIIDFDPKVLKPTLITIGNYFKVIANQSIQSNFVKISSLAEVTETDINFPSGKGLVATIQFDILSQSTQSAITIDKEKTIIASNGKNILDKTEDVTISVNP